VEIINAMDYMHLLDKPQQFVKGVQDDGAAIIGC